MAFGAVLDTCVLYPFSLCDILLRLADRELYDPYWSGLILEELARNLVEHGLTPAQAGHRVEQMRRAFPAAEVATAAVARLEPAMTNDPKDRHVLAAAVASKVDAVVTFNLRDFAAEACDPYDVDVLHPDRFLVDLYDLDHAGGRGRDHGSCGSVAKTVRIACGSGPHAGPSRGAGLRGSPRRGVRPRAAIDLAAPVITPLRRSRSPRARTSSNGRSVAFACRPVPHPAPGHPTARTPSRAAVRWSHHRSR